MDPTDFALRPETDSRSAISEPPLGYPITRRLYTGTQARISPVVGIPDC